MFFHKLNAARCVDEACFLRGNVGEDEMRWRGADESFEGARGESKGMQGNIVGSNER